MADCFPSTFTEFDSDNFSKVGASVSIFQAGLKLAMNTDLFTTEGKLPVEGKIFFNSFKLATIACKPFATLDDKIQDKSKWVGITERKIYCMVNGNCYEGVITDPDGSQYTGSAFQVNLTQVGEVVVCTEDAFECPDGSYVTRDPNNDCKFPECPSVPEPPATPTPTPEVKIISSTNEFTDIKNCIDKKPQYHSLFNLQENTMDDGEFVCTDEVNGQISFSVRSSMPLTFQLYYNKLQPGAFSSSEDVPLSRIGSLVFFEKDVADLSPSNFADRKVCSFSKYIYGDDEMLVQIDSATASKFEVKEGCYTTDFGKSDDVIVSSWATDTLLDGDLTITVLKEYNLPTPTPSPTPTPTPSGTPTPTPTQTPTPTPTAQTYKIFPLQQKPESLTYYMGWYGICGYDCKPYSLVDDPQIRNKIFRVLQINKLNDNYSIFNAEYEPAIDAFQDFLDLECQRPYLIVLRPGTDSIHIPGFVEASAISENAGLLTLWCGPIAYTAGTPTPTPTPSPSPSPTGTPTDTTPPSPTPTETPTATPTSMVDHCIKKDCEISVVDSKYNFGDMGYVMPYKLNVGIYNLTGVPAGHPIFLTDHDESKIKLEGDEANKVTDSGKTGYTGDVTLTVYSDFGVVSYACVYHGYMGGENNLQFSNSCGVGYDGLPETNDSTEGETEEPPAEEPPEGETEEPPVEEPPVEEPTEGETEEPILELEFRWYEINGKEILQVKNLLQPTHEVDGEKTFSNRDMSKWSTVYGVTPTSMESSYTLGHQAWPDAAVAENYTPTEHSFDGLKIDLDGNGGYLQLYIDVADTKHMFLGSSGVVDISGMIPMFIYSGDNSDSENSALGKTDMWPVVVKGADSESTMDFESMSNEYQQLPQADRNDHSEAKGEVVYENLEGGFYGIVVYDASGNPLAKYLPINLQDKLKEDVGNTIKLQSFYSEKDAMSIFMWGTLVYVEAYTIEADQIAF